MDGADLEQDVSVEKKSRQAAGSLLTSAFPDALYYDVSFLHAEDSSGHTDLSPSDLQAYHQDAFPVEVPQKHIPTPCCGIFDKVDLPCRYIVFSFSCMHSDSPLASMRKSYVLTYACTCQHE